MRLGKETGATDEVKGEWCGVSTALMDAVEG